MMEAFSDFLTKLEEQTKSFTLSASQVKKIQRFLKDEILDGLNPEKDVNDEDNHITGAKDNQEADSKQESKPKRRRLTQEEKDQREAAKKAEAARLKPLKEARKKRLAEQLKDSATAKTMIDWDKVNRWRDYAGYYQIVTSELEMDDLTIINTYRQLTRIESRFRTMKGTLQTRPIYVRTPPEHIEAHLTLCCVALILMALIQGKTILSDKEPKVPKRKWNLGLDPDRVQGALNALELEVMPESYLRFRDSTTGTNSEDIEKILSMHNISLESRLYTPGELRTMRGSVNTIFR